VSCPCWPSRRYPGPRKPLTVEEALRRAREKVEAECERTAAAMEPPMRPVPFLPAVCGEPDE
jgi:hypothetical protein